MRKVEERRRADGRRTFFVRFRHAGRQTSEVFDTPAAARQFARELDALGSVEALDRLYAGPQREAAPTLSEVAARHIERLHHAEPGTRTKYRALWERTWGPQVGEAPIDLVTLDMLSAALAELAETYSEKSLKNQRGLLMSVLDRAVEDGLISANPAKKRLRLPPARGRNVDDMRIITPAEFVIIEEGMHPHYRPLIRFLFGTGTRWGEATALTAGDVRIPNVTIRRAVKYSPGEYRVGAPKTKRGRRTIALPPEVQADLIELTAGKNADELVFTAIKGGRIDHGYFWRMHWNPVAGLIPAPRPRIHDLRHSHASILLGAGVPIHVVQLRLGHESIKTTVDTYTHLMPDAQRAAAEAAALAFAHTRELL